MFVHEVFGSLLFDALKFVVAFVCLFVFYSTGMECNHRFSDI